MYMQLLLGKLELNSIVIKHTGNHYKPPVELNIKIEYIWNKAKEKYGDKLWNGQIIDLNE